MPFSTDDSTDADSIVLVTTTSPPLVVTGSSWARDDGGNVHVYDGDETVATADGDHFAAVVRNGEVMV